MGLKKYPIYNPIAYAGLTLIDFLLNACLTRSTKQISIPDKLLICNCAHLGDVILTTALLPAIKEAYPHLKIGMVVGQWSLPVIKNHPLIDTIHSVNHGKKARRKALKDIKTINYDAAIDCCFHFPNLAPLLWQAKIPIRVGFKSAGLSPFLTHSLPWKHDENRSAIEAYFSLLKLFGNFKNTSLTPSLPLAKKKKVEPYIVMHMGTRDKKKQWPLTKWSALTKRLLDQGYKLYFTGLGEKEDAAIKQIHRHYPVITNLCNQLTWSEFVTTIQNAKLLISVDSCAGHLAAVTNTPAILLFTGIHPPKLWRPSHRNIRIITKQMACSPCFKGCESMTCIQGITVDEVFAEIASLVECEYPLEFFP